MSNLPRRRNKSCDTASTGIMTRKNAIHPSLVAGGGRRGRGVAYGKKKSFPHRLKVGSRWHVMQSRVGLGGVVIQTGRGQMRGRCDQEHFWKLFFLQSGVMDGAEAGHHLALSAARRAYCAPPLLPPAIRRPPLINGARRQSPEAEIKYFCLNVTFVSFAAVERDICQNRWESPPPPPPARPDFLWERGGELLPASTRAPLRLLIPGLWLLTGMKGRRRSTGRKRASDFLVM